MTILDALADLVLGATCPGCATPGFTLCGACRVQLSGPPRAVSRDLQVPLIAAAAYRPVLAHVIPRYKDDGALHLDRLLGGLLGEAVTVLEPSPGTVLVPVPSLPRAVRMRGFDHCHRLARVAAARTRLRAKRGLTRVAAGYDQRLLGRADRTRNLAGTMRSVGLRSPAIVVDDVVTTGASLKEAIRALRAAGTVVLGAAVIADADRR